MKQLVASIMTANQLEIQNEIEQLLDAGITWLHCDVMDGIFVNNLAMGPYEIEQLMDFEELTLDIHLATVMPEKYIDMFGPLKPDYITFHIETTTEPEKLFKQIRSYGSKVGLAFSPETPVKEIEKYLDKIDLLLVMTVNPGFAGQQFNDTVIDKMIELKAIFDKANFKRPLVEVDGNIYETTIKKMQDLDVDLFVLGTSALFNKSKNTYKEKSEKLIQVINDL